MTTPTEPSLRHPGEQPSHIAGLRAIIAAAIVSTAIHYTHNFIAVHSYPGPHGAFDTITRVLIVISWPVLTGIGLIGYRRYREGRSEQAQLALAIYSVTGILTLGHFVFGSPRIPALFYATLFTDTLTGLAVLFFALRYAKPNARRLGTTSAEETTTV